MSRLCLQIQMFCVISDIKNNSWAPLPLPWRQLCEDPETKACCHRTFISRIQSYPHVLLPNQVLSLRSLSCERMVQWITHWAGETNVCWSIKYQRIVCSDCLQHWHSLIKFCNRDLVISWSEKCQQDPELSQDIGLHQPVVTFSQALQVCAKALQWASPLATRPILKVSSSVTWRNLNM